MSPKRACGSLGRPFPGSKGAGDVDKVIRIWFRWMDSNHHTRRYARLTLASALHYALMESALLGCEYAISSTAEIKH